VRKTAAVEERVVVEQLSYFYNTGKPKKELQSRGRFHFHFEAVIQLRAGRKTRGGRKEEGATPFSSPLTRLTGEGPPKKGGRSGGYSPSLFPNSRAALPKEEKGRLQ